jgi:hypothetical protein
VRVAIVGAADGASDLDSLLELSTLANQQWLRTHPDTPNLYLSGVRYRRETTTHGGHNEERFLTIPWVLHLGWGDCDDLAPWRAAELRESLVDPYAAARSVRMDPFTWHIIVLRGNGQVEDPSRLLGMEG